MAKDVIMPVLGMNQDTALLVSWLAQEGDDVVEGEPLMEVETDKAVMELDAPASGTLIDVTAAEGDDVVVGSVIARILADGEARAAPQTAPGRATSTGPSASADTGAATARTAPSAPTPPAAQPASATPAASQTPVASPSSDGSPRAAASPLARRTARERGLELAAITGTGPFGAVLLRDLADAAARGAIDPDGEAGEADTAAIAGEATTGRADQAAPGLSPDVSPALAPTGLALAELERRTDARALTALLAASGDVPIHAALAKFLAAVVRRRLAIDPSDGVTLQVRGPDGRATVPHADLRSMVDLTERTAATDDDAAPSDAAAPDPATPEAATPDAVLVHAGDLPIDAVRPVAAAPVSLGLGRPAATADDPAPLTLTLRYDPARVGDATAVTILTDLVRLVGDPAALAVAF